MYWDKTKRAERICYNMTRRRGLGEQPIDYCKRWIAKKESKYILVPRPNIIKSYNESMGGIDLIDRMISYYRMSARTKKWTVKTILHLIDLSIANSWVLYRKDRKRMGDSTKAILKFLDFKLQLANTLLTVRDNTINEEYSILNLSLITRNHPLEDASSPRSTQVCAFNTWSAQTCIQNPTWQFGL
ncbi:hypothetical protein D910_11344 [Dendroctonus ponderosae]|uniref:PiggyBac transposable element-derived protein domain-containing protein n=1 Tax=Dendroctonus ponderosae TaxID=77166 RepID=U4UV08_DENPD|nr:hypothetical protein D910_11344 [Dendroctonus ponderosae]